MEFLEVHSRKRKRRISDNKTKLPGNIQASIEKLFEKKFVYEKKENYSTDTSFSEKSLCPEWQVEEFISMKNELNTLKNELNDKDMITWHDHTRLVNLAGNIAPEIRNQFRPELCTQAWCKFYEIASTYLNLETKKSFFTVHLCEAPGAFVTSLNHFLFTHSDKGEWQWLATTLNPYYEGNNIGQMIDEDRFISRSYSNWYFGEDGTGNLMSGENLAGLKEKLGTLEVDLVTADGSIDCQGDPAEQENVVSHLQHCEVLTALHILSPGGTLVVKMFTMFECKAIGLMYLLNCVFDRVEVFKPCTSKGGNSEVYVIGLDYKGKDYCVGLLKNITPVYFGVNEPNGCLFAREDIPESFLQQHTQCVQFFKDCQMSAIQRNLDLLKVMNDEERSKVEEQKDYCMECFFSRYDMKSLTYSNRIMRLSKGKKSGSSRNTEFATKAKLEGKFIGSFSERQELSNLPWQQKMEKIETYEEDVDKEDNSLWIQCEGEYMSDKEVELFQTVSGKAVESIQSSRFCHGFYLGQVHEIIKHSQWLPLHRQRDTKFVKHVAQKLRELLSETIQYYSDIPECRLQTLSDQCINTKTQTLGVNNHMDSVSDEGSTGEQDCQGMSVVTGKNCRKISEENFIGEQSYSCIPGKELAQTGINMEQKQKFPCSNNNKTGDSVKESIKTACRCGCVTEIDSFSCTRTGENAGIRDGSDENSGDISDNDDSSINSISRHTGIYCSCVCGDSTLENTTNEETTTNIIAAKEPKFTCSLINRGSPVLQELLHQGCGDCTSVPRGINVRLYSASDGICSDRLELLEQNSLLAVVQDILKDCQTSDYVVIEMGSCLSRFTAGLVYILYRCFKEIGFVHHHGNLLKRHLVCIDYQACSVRLWEYLEKVDHMMKADQSQSVLEIIPVLTLLEDETFTSFLRISNVNLLQSFITTVVNEEKQMYSCQTDKT